MTEPIYKRQPECSATMPPVMRANSTRRKPAARIMSAKVAGGGNWRIELGEVAIRFRIAGDHAAERRNDVERVEIIEPVETGHVHARELEAEKVPAWAQYAERLRQGGVDTRHVADAERDRVGVEALVGKDQRFSVAFREDYVLRKVALDGTLAPDLQHIGIDVADRDPRAGAAGTRQAERHVAGTARHIEHRESAGVVWRLHGTSPTRPSTPGAARPTSGRSSGRSGARPR